LSIWISCSGVLFGCKSTLEYLVVWNSGKNSLETYIYYILGEITVAGQKKFQDLNINKSYFSKSHAIRRNFN
jgi:hypothetical protein